MFSPSLSKLLHLQSTKNTYKNIANINTYITGVPFIRYFPCGCSRVHEDTCSIIVNYMTININILLYTEIPYYGKESLTIEGDPSLPYYINSSFTI